MNPSNAARSSRCVVGPPVVELRHDVVAHGHRAEQVLEPALRVGKPFHVEEHVPVGRRRQLRQAAARLRRVGRAVAPQGLRVPARLELELRLDPQPLEDLLRDLGHATRGLAPRERGQRRDAGLLEPAHLAAGDVRHPAQVVGRGEQLLGGLLPAAPAPVESGVGHPGRVPRRLKRREGPAKLAVVVEVVPGGKGLLLAVAEQEDDLGGAEAADRLEHVGVGAELDQEGGLGGAGELGVPGGVVPGAAAAAIAGAAEEEVGIAAPAVGDEVGLVDDRGPGLHGGEGPRRSLRVVAVHFDDRGVLLAEVLEVTLLVLDALFDREVGFRVPFVGGGPLPARPSRRRVRDCARRTSARTTRRSRPRGRRPGRAASTGRCRPGEGCMRGAPCSVGRRFGSRGKCLPDRTCTRWRGGVTGGRLGAPRSGRHRARHAVAGLLPGWRSWRALTRPPRGAPSLLALRCARAEPY